MASCKPEGLNWDTVLEQMMNCLTEDLAFHSVHISSCFQALFLSILEHSIDLDSLWHTARIFAFYSALFTINMVHL